MFKFLKKLFTEPEEEEIIRDEIKLEELGAWFKSKSDKTFSDLDAQIKDIKGKVNEEVLKAKDNLAILGTAKLHNPKITVKEIQFMEGNRKAYILAVNTFLRGIDLEKDDYSSLTGFCDDFNTRLERFGKSTVRTYHILQEFFSHESRNIAINVKNLGSFIGTLGKGITDAKIGKIDDIKKSIADLNEKINQKRELENLLGDKEKVKDGLIKNKGDIEREIEDLVKGEEYEQLNELKANKEVVLATIRDHNAKIVHAFSVMERPLRKLTRVVIEEGELLNRYIENPVEALISDKGLKIVGLLKKLESNINNLTLELKDKKRDKVLETVKGLTEEFLREFINRHNELDEKLENIEKHINDNEALKGENKLNYELENVMDNLEKVNAEILESEQILSKISIGEMKNSLSRNINELLGMDVVIS